MLSRSLLKFLLTSASVSTLCSQLNTVAHAQAIHWPRQELIIPFQVHQQGTSPDSVELEVSSDAGKTWQVAGKAKITNSDSKDRQFPFRADRDGEYWFRVKSLDRSGNLIDQPGEPMRVSVDSTKPTGELLIDLDKKGDLQAEFRVLDSALDFASLRLEYQTELDSAWKDIPCQTERGNTEQEWIGSASWSIPHQATQLMVRLTGKDHAGNGLEVTRMPKLPKTAHALVGGMRFASTRQTSDSTPPVAGPIASGPATSGPIIGSGVAKPTLPAGLNLGAPTGAAVTANSAANPTPAPQSLLTNKQSANLPVNNLPVNNLPISSGIAPVSIAPPKMFTSTGLPVRSIEDKPIETTSGSNPSELLGADGSNKTKSNSVSELPRLDPPINRLDTAGIKPMYSSSKAFDLDYAIVNDPGAPISTVELWGTLDQGKTWERWGTDSDRESPFEIEVETEGLFGFRMVIVGSNGLASRRPLPGDAADAWIHVDTLMPRVRILSALAGKGPEAGSLIIEYQAIDEHFIDRPIGLCYSESPQGPWIPITQGAKNQGRFVWAGDTHLPEKVYLKLQGTDAAGNVGEHVLDLPVDVQSAAPRGKIQGFRPR